MNQGAVSVIGQIGDINEYVPDFAEYIPNTDSPVNNVGFSSPTDITIDTKHHLGFVADKRNHRVLIYELTNENEFSDQRADYVLGQPDFEENVAGTSPNADSYMSSPTGIAVDLEGNRLFVSDSGNHRVLIYTGISATRFNNSTKPDFVLGQSDLNDGVAPGSITASNLESPRGVSYSRRGFLYVADTLRNRILRFNLKNGITNGQAADTVIGQKDLASDDDGGQFGPPNRFKLPRNVLVDGDYLYVSDTQHNRVIIFRESAILLPAEFTGTYENGNNPMRFIGMGEGVDFNKLRSPQNLAANAKYIFVSDSYNNRVLAYEKTSEPAPIEALPSFAIGQQKFKSNIVSYDENAGPNEHSLRYPLGLAFVPDSCALYVADNGFNRILQYKNDGSCNPPVTNETTTDDSPVACDLDNECDANETCSCEDCLDLLCSGNDFCDMNNTCVANTTQSSASFGSSMSATPSSSVASSSAQSSSAGGGGSSCSDGGMSENC